MALIVKYDEEQLRQIHEDNEKIVKAIEAHSTNVGKWQSEQAKAIIAGFSALTGIDIGEIQAKIDSLTEQLKTGTDELEAAVKANQPE